MSSADPLSFFAGDDSSSSEDDEDGREEGKDCPPSEPEVSNPNRLPSPDSLFATVKKPSFLTAPSKRHVDWDQFVKNDADAQVNIHLGEGDGNYAAIAPPKDINDGSGSGHKKVHSSLSAAIIRTYSNTGEEISAPPVRYSTKEVDAKFRTVSDDIEGGMSQVGSKRAGPDTTGEEDATKKQKTENFRQKEKRKRNLGQTSRGTSYVEEEKRVLRQQFATDEIMN